MYVPMEMIDVVERFGSLGILIIVAFYGLRWAGVRVDRMLTHNERLIEQNRRMIEQFSGAVDVFKEFETEERKTHEQIMRRLDRIEGRA